MSEADKIISPMGQEFELPPSVTVSTFTAARSKEIEFMNNTINTITATKMVFQKLPKHMRRRAMSHNVKRLPRRVRQIHLNQMKKSGTPPQSKRPSRKYRRRPYNLTNEYAKRQRRFKWLDTHIWHAKRFHMIEKWGFKLPERPCDRAFRACYRATAKHCLVQDISYVGCIEISGNKDYIIEKFKQITDSNTGLSIGAKCYTLGHREGNITIFHPSSNDSKGRKAIGSVNFLWKQCDQVKSVLWVFAHAAFFNEVLDVLISCFELQQSDMDNNVQYTNFNGMKLKDLRNELVRFRLTGPLSNAVLQNAFRLVHWSDKTQDLPKWVESTNVDTLIRQNNYWNSLQMISSTSQLSPHMILPLIIRDPRFHLPQKRTKSVYEMNSICQLVPEFPKDISSSPIWDKNVRQYVKENKMPSAKISEMRSALLVPGTELEYKGDIFPVILIQRPGKSSKECLGYASGWDIIIPSGWAQPLWISLNMWGARSGGLRETDSICFEQSHTHFLAPDTLAGSQEEKEYTQKCKEKFFRLPPNKRVNFNKFKICSPFEYNWKVLLNDWKHESVQEISTFHVLRDKNILKNMHEIMTGKIKLTDNVKDFCTVNSNYLVPVVVKMFDKGLCQQSSIICLPKHSDAKKVPTEPICVDSNAQDRKTLRQEHKTLLKRLKRRRKLGRKTGKIIPIDKELLKNYTNKIRELWLPEAVNIRHSCSREVMGFITKGDFSFLIGQSKGVGYISMLSLLNLFELKCKNKVLVRNTNSRQYRLACMDVIFE